MHDSVLYILNVAVELCRNGLLLKYKFQVCLSSLLYLWNLSLFSTVSQLPLF
jgi:hypothetical protein